ncbi:MAG: T9SS type A sorting domain-containing protein [Hymenobacteraceae bacterium]|nr:T9SS type A sorting domain-containing protein [Hymenobacteraceae bacterium]
MAAFATHFKGGQITYEHRGGGQYLITIKSYWKNNTLDNIVPTYSGNPVINSPRTTISTMPLPDGVTTERVEQQLVTWTSPGLYYISWTSCCRVSGGSNFSMVPNGLFAAVNYDPANPSSSPQFYDLPVFNFVAGNPLSFSFNNEDPENHVQDYSLSIPYGVSGNPYSTMMATGFQVSGNGVVSWSNPQRGLWLVNVKLEERINGVLTGAYVFRDFMLNITSSGNVAPVLAQVAPQTVMEGQPLQFNVSATDANGNAVKLQASGLPFSNGATFNQHTAGSAAAGTFYWTPPAGSARTYQLQFTATDNASVPLSSQITVPVTVTTLQALVTCDLQGTTRAENATCVGASNGSIAVTIAGGTAPYEYSIDGGNTYQSSNEFTNLTAGTYTVDVKDAANCTTVFTDVRVGEDPLPTVSFTAPASVCVNAASVQLPNVSPAGGVFSGAGVNGNSFNPAVAGTGVHTLTYTYTNAAGCANAATATITVLDAPVANAGADATVYLGYAPTECTTLSASATGGTGAYTYSWSNGANTASISVCPSATTTYTVTITDAAGCSSTDQVTVNVVDVRCGKKLDKVLVCHNGHEICIAPQAVPAHLAHGCALGSCSSAGAGMMAAEATLTAYPNPFAAQTTIQVEALTDGVVALAIYDLKGSLVKQIHKGEVSAGQVYTFDVDAANLPGGIYVAALVSATQVQNLKLVISK